MFLTCEIFCEDYVKEPSYRLYINGELIVDRDFVIPSDIYSHYEFGADLDLPDGTNTIVVESVKGNPEFILGVVTINNKKTSCTNGKFII